MLPTKCYSEYADSLGRSWRKYRNNQSGYYVRLAGDWDYMWIAWNVDVRGWCSRAANYLECQDTGRWGYSYDWIMPTNGPVVCWTMLVDSSGVTSCQ